MKVSNQPRSARDVVYDIQQASECIRQDNAQIDRLFTELQDLVDGPKTVPAGDDPQVKQTPLHNHNPVQHRDGREPWCDVCFLTAAMREPEFQVVAPNDNPLPTVDIYPPGYKGERS